MSHFTVIVVGENIEKQLEPFWELDLTQEDAAKDPRAKFDDRTEEVLSGWETDTIRMVYPDHRKMVKDLPKGSVKNFIYKKSDPFDRLPQSGQTIMFETKDGEEAWFKIIRSLKLIDEICVDMEKIDGFPNVSVKEKYKDINEYAKEYHGYAKNSDGRYGYYKNPNAKWDWYVVGGRWTGYLKLKEINSPDASYGELGVFDSLDVRDGKARIQDIQKIGFCDSTFKRNIDVEGMEKPERELAEKQWDEFHQYGYDKIFQVIPEPNEKNPFHKEYKKLPKDMLEWISKLPGSMSGYEELKQLATWTREEYVACRSVWSPYALLWEGKWYSRGEMGWFGISFNREPQWNGTFKELWEQIPEDTLITVVDCHI